MQPSVQTPSPRARDTALPSADGPVALPARADEAEAVGLEIGRDHARFGLVPPVDHLHAGHPVRRGWETARPAFAGRTRRPTLHVRRWLQWRLQAWLRAEPFDALHVTPRLLRALDADRCPVTREPLESSGGALAEACLEPLDRGAGWTAGNLVLMSRRAVQARDHRDAGQCLEVAQRLAHEGGSCAGLDADAWGRLATLLSFGTALPHAQAAALPLRLLPPARVRVLNPAQALQVLLTARFTQPGRGSALGDVARLFPDAVRPAVHAFMTTLLARRLSAFEGPGIPSARALRDAMERAWQHPLVTARWQRLVSRLEADQCEAIVQRAAHPGLGGFGARWLPDAVPASAQAASPQACLAFA